MSRPMAQMALTVSRHVLNQSRRKRKPIVLLGASRTPIVEPSSLLVR